MSIFTKLFSTDKALDTTNNIFNKVSGGIDKLALTKQEQLELKSDLMKAFEPFKLIQRYIALTILFLFVILVLTVAVFKVLSYWYSGMAVISEDIYKLLKDVVFVPFTIILSLYFTGGIPFLKTKK